MEEPETLEDARTTCEDQFGGELLKSKNKDDYEHSTEFLNSHFGVSSIIFIIY